MAVIALGAAAAGCGFSADAALTPRKIADVALPRALNAEGHLSISDAGLDILVERKVETPSTGPRLVREPRPTPSLMAETPLYRLERVISLNADRSSVTVLDKATKVEAWIVNGRTAAASGARRLAKVQPEWNPEYCRRQTETVDMGRGRTGRVQILLPAEGPLLDALRAKTTPDGVRFEDAYGTPVFPGEEPITVVVHDYGVAGGWTGTRGLFAIVGAEHVEITFSSPYDGMHMFYYDPSSKRVLALAGQDGPILFDLTSRSRKTLPDPNGAEREYYLVPGRDALVVRECGVTRDGHNYTGKVRFFLSNLDGERIADLPRHGSSGKLMGFPWHVACSHDLIAYTLGEVVRVCVIE